jgi:hypothetical protein
MSLCGTDAGAFLNFFAQAKSYRRVILGYLTDKNAFVNLRYTVGTDLTIDELPDTRDVYMRMIDEGYDRENNRPKYPPPPISDIPRFYFRPVSLVEHVRQASDDLGFLVLLNLLLIMSSVLIVNRSSLN